MQRQNSNTRSAAVLNTNSQGYKKELSKQLLLTKPDLDRALFSNLVKRKFTESGQGKILVTKKRLIRKKETQTISLLEASVNTEDNEQLLNKSQRALS